MLQAWLGSGTLDRDQIVITEKDAEKRDSVGGRYGVATSDEIARAAADADIVVLAVKPQDADAVLGELSGSLEPGAVLMSIAAGLTIAFIRGRIGDGPMVVRVMPNMAASVGASVSAFAIDPGEGVLDRGRIAGLLEAFGETVEVEESQMNLVTALSGSGPAYFFLMVEALEKAGAGLGMPTETARLLARETLWGAARVLKETGRDAGELREAVSSPGGTTLAALAELERLGFVDAVRDAVEAASTRAGELAK
jgi:pyrroline-5-carboxylate reductase